jgi:photoactive yellow protein
MTEAEFDGLPHGAIQLDAQGNILRYNAYEERLSGMKKENVIGKNFFTQVAPCTNVQEFYGRFRDGVRKGRLYCRFRYRFAFKKNPIDVTIRLFYSATDKNAWVLVEPVKAVD